MKSNILLTGGVLKTGMTRSVVSLRGLASDSVDLSSQDVDVSQLTGKRKTPKRKLHEVNPFKGIEEYGLLQSLFRGPSGSDKSENQSRQSLSAQIKRLRQLEEFRIRKQTRHVPNASTRSDAVSFVSNQHAQSERMSQWATEQSRYSQPLSKNTLSPESLEKIAFLMRDSNTISFTPLDIDNWLKMNIILTSNKLVTQELLAQFINEIINKATTANLPIVMEYLLRYWEKGFENVTADALEAKKHLVLVLNKALQVITTIDYQEEGSIANNSRMLESYQGFYNAFFAKFKWPESHELQDLWFQIVAKSAPIQEAEALMNEYYFKQDKLPSRQATDVFIKALIKYTDNQRLHFVGSEVEFVESVKNDLSAYTSLLVSSQITPAVCEFLLLWTTSLSEVYSILELSVESDYADQIFSQCQVDILRTVVRCSLNDYKAAASTESQTEPEEEQRVPADPKYYVPVHAKAMAHMFGVLNRFTNYSKGITLEALDECLLLSAKYGNSAGMYRSLSMRLGLEDNKKGIQIPVSIISQVFDSFPMSSGAMAKESKDVLWVVNNTIVSDPKRDQVILYHLRTMINQAKDTAAYTKYIGALGRCGRSDRLYWEWQDFTTNNSNWIQYDDLVMHFMSANKNANSLEVGYQILDTVLEESCEPSRRAAATNILVKTIKYNALPTRDMLERFCTWLVEDTEKTASWELGEVSDILQETGLSVEKNRLLDTIEQARAHANADNAKREIQSIWAEVY